MAHTRRCYGCAQHLPLEDFTRNRSKTQGRNYICRPCGRGEGKRLMVKARYGLDLEDYEAYMALPCQVCGEESQHLDHDHETGRIRGPLCQGCNRGIGFLRDNPDNLRKAARYLELV